MPNIGEIVTGKVIRLKPKHALLSLNGGGKGFLRISQISKGYVKNIEDVLAVGQEVTGRVIAHNPKFNEWEISLIRLDEEKYKKERFDEQMKKFMNDSKDKQRAIARNRDRKHGVKPPVRKQKD